MAQDIRPALPDHPVPEEVTNRSEWRLEVAGLVDRPGAIGLGRIRELPRVAITDDFACEEGWQVPGLTWSGVPLREVIALAGARPEGRHVRIGSGGFHVTLPIADVGVDLPLLADSLNGSPLTVEHGAPLRLIAPGNACYASIKWVDCIEVLAEPAGPDTAPVIARERLRRE